MQSTQPDSAGIRRWNRPDPSSAEEKMVLVGTHRELSQLEDLELRRHRLAELIELQLVSPSLSEQIKKAIAQLDQQITAIKQQPMRIAA
jgi:hypothetical protein